MYSVCIINEAGSAVSEEVKLTVVQPVTILSQPNGGINLIGQTL